MGNLKERESRRRASVVGSIIEQQPADETKQRSAGRGATETGESVCSSELV